MIFTEQELARVDWQAQAVSLAYSLRRLLERINHNGGLGPYTGGPAFVMIDARLALEAFDAATKWEQP